MAFDCSEQRGTAAISTLSRSKQGRGSMHARSFGHTHSSCLLHTLQSLPLYQRKHDESLPVRHRCDGDVLVELKVVAHGCTERYVVDLSVWTYLSNDSSESSLGSALVLLARNQALSSASEHHSTMGAESSASAYHAQARHDPRSETGARTGLDIARLVHQQRVP